MTSLRFTVGSEVPFIDLKFVMFNGNKAGIGLGSSYLPWEDKLISIAAVDLICAEHHKVAWNYAPEDARYDGFIFKSLDGSETWNNQYPSASLGQTSAEADYHVHRRIQNPDPTSRKNRPEVLTGMVEAAHYLDNILEGIKHYRELADRKNGRREIKGMDDSVRADTLQQHFDNVSALLVDLGYSVTTETLTDFGDVPYPGFLRAIVTKQKFAAQTQAQEVAA